MRILVSGGGTAGHVSPAVATIQALNSLNKSTDILYVGRRGGLEDGIASASGIAFAPIVSGKFRRRHGAGKLSVLADFGNLGPNIIDIFKLMWGVVQSIIIIYRFDPDIIFIKGGFVALPVGLAARLMHRPYVVHESDLEPGLANRILAPGASAMAVGFPVKNYRHSLKVKGELVFTGSPVRKELTGRHRFDGLAHFKLSTDLPVVLVTGGSQGAVSLNSAVVDALPQLVERFQVIHITGEYDVDRVRFEVRRRKLDGNPRYRAIPYLQGDMGYALAAADLVVARAGATTIAELALLAKPTILVPNTQMAGHQAANAKLLGRAGAARVISDERLTPALLTAEIERILDNPAEQAELERNITEFANPNAANELAKLIMSHARIQPQPEEADE